MNVECRGKILSPEDMPPRSRKRLQVSALRWFRTGDIPQEELEAGYPQGMPRYIRHTSGIPFTYVKQLMRFRTGAHHLAIETGRWARPKLPRQHRVCSKCSCTVVEDEVHFLFECPAYDRIREKYNTVLFAQFGGCQEASSTMKHNSDNVRLFMDQEPSFQVAKFVYECMEFRRSEECEDYNPYFDLSLFGDEWQGRIFDTFSSGPRGDISSCLVVWIPLFLDPSDGVFGRFDLAALCGCRTLNFCLFVCLLLRHSLLMDQVPVFLPMEPRLAPYGRPL